MRLLSPLFAAVDLRGFGQVLLAEFPLDVATGHFQRIARQVGRIGTHVGDVTRFVQTLGHHHGFLHAEPQAIARRLLQGRGDEGR